MIPTVSSVLERSTITDRSHGESNTASTSRDEIFSMLSNQRRRWVIRCLVHEDQHQMDFRTLVDTLASLEYDRPIEEISWDQRKRIYTALRQAHLPKLAETGIIEYDKNRGTVELTEKAQEAHMYLKFVPEHDIDWSQYYLGLTVIAASLFLLSVLAIYPFAGLSGWWLSVIVITMFGSSAVAQYLTLDRTDIGTIP